MRLKKEQPIINLTGEMLWSDYNMARSSLIDMHQFLPEGWKIGDDRFTAFQAQMIELGVTLTKITGHETSWCWIASACNPFGDYGYFITRKIKPWYERWWHLALCNRFWDVYPKKYWPKFKKA